MISREMPLSYPPACCFSATASTAAVELLLLCSFYCTSFCYNCMSVAATAKLLLHCCCLCAAAAALSLHSFCCCCIYRVCVMQGGISAETSAEGGHHISCFAVQKPLERRSADAQHSCFEVYGNVGRLVSRLVMFLKSSPN